VVAVLAVGLRGRSTPATVPLDTVGAAVEVAA
jgi:hypothetical protein